MVRPADEDFHSDDYYDSRTDEEIVGAMVDEAIRMLALQNPEDDRLEIMECVAIAFRNMLRFPAGQNFSKRDDLLPDCLMEVTYRIKTEQDKRLGHIH